MLGLTAGDSVLAVGILLDILGVVVLAVPDLPWAARRFRFGRLRAARDTLRYSDLTSGDVGFEDIVRLHDESQPNVEISQSDIDKIDYVAKRQPVFDDGGDVKDSEINFQLSFEYADNAEFAGVGIQTLSVPPGRFYPRILRIIERGERNFRLLGLLLIGLGFGFQLTSVWMF